MRPEGRALRRFLERAFVPGLPGASVLEDVVSSPVDEGGWYGAWSLDVRLADGTGHRLFLKDYGIYRQPKRDMAGRRERERCVYRGLLRPDRHGTARYHGSEWDREAGRYWLLLEFVEGVPVSHLALEAWCRSAAWLARFQASRPGGPAAGPCRGRLVTHDRRFFVDVAARAVEALSTRSRRRGRQLRRTLREYGDWVDGLLVEDAPVFVHGAYLPGQILSSGDGEDRRLCPLDWELAALGSPAYDLGFLAYGFQGEERAALLGAYRRELERAGGEAPDDLSRRVACVGVHYTLTALAHSAERGYDDGAVLEYLDLLEGLVERAGPGEAGVTSPGGRGPGDAVTGGRAGG